MKILILGVDGYLGWPTAMYFARKGHEVIGSDNFSKRLIEMECGVTPLKPISTLQKRVAKWNLNQDNKIKIEIGDLINSRFIYNLLENEKPDVIIHYAEQPSAPYSMKGRKEAVYTQKNNIIGNLNLMFAIKAFCPGAHLIKLGTMGVYGTPNIDIEEGYIDIEHNGRKDKMHYPKNPLSYYHLSKTIDSQNLNFACQTWGLKVTDLHQGVVYGINTNETILDEDLNTSFHYDSIFGTVINRFCVQAAIGKNLTVYGEGLQKRTFLNIMDTLQCIEIAANNDISMGEYRVFNQFTEIFSINEIAELVKSASIKMGKKIEINNLENPRVEKSKHYFNPKNDNFMKLGLKPRKLSETIIDEVLYEASKNSSLINQSLIMPNIKWDSKT